MEWITRTTILNELRTNPESENWNDLVEIFSPIIMFRAAERGLQPTEVEEVLQDTLADFIEALQTGKYDRNRGHLHDWLLGIAGNKIRSFVRARRRRLKSERCAEVHEIRDVPDKKAAEKTWDTESGRIVLSACLKYAFKKSSRKTFYAFVLCVFKGLSPMEVSEKLGMRVDAVHVAKHRVLARMREYVERHYQTV